MIDFEFEPERMTRDEAIEFLECVVADCEMKLEALHDEKRNAEG